MTIVVRLLREPEKGHGLAQCCKSIRSGHVDERVFDISHVAFKKIPSSPFAYWIPPEVADVFGRYSRFGSSGRSAKQGIATADDFRFIRVWWEVDSAATEAKDGATWIPIAKGGSFSPYYADLPAVVNWGHAGHEMKAWAGSLYNNSHWSRILKNIEMIGRPGISWPLRGVRFSAQAIPKGAAFSVAGKMAFVPEDEILGFLAIFNSKLFDYFIRLFAGKVGGVQYQNGLIADIPVPPVPSNTLLSLGALALQAWSLRRTQASSDERSHSFVLPVRLVNDNRHDALDEQVAVVQRGVDDLVFELYGFDSQAQLKMDASEIPQSGTESDLSVDDDGDGDGDAEIDVSDDLSPLLSWSVGVAFGRFDWRLATGDREIPPEPGPFDALPAKSPGMLPDGAAPFHAHAGILVDDGGHPHNLVRLVEEVLARVDAPVPSDLGRWLQKDFFPFHLQRYSKSRRKAPIYWPLSTLSGSYTLWVYYPSLNRQTLYTAINDFVEPKLKRVGDDVAALRNKGSARTRDDERQFEALQSLKTELLELRDKLLEIAPGYKPNHDDGVQITAAPLWPLFRHKPWQRALKDTWAKLESGDYDWAHLAMAYWPDRVREKCKTDKSLAIAHGLEDLYVEPKAAPRKTRGRKKAADVE